MRQTLQSKVNPYFGGVTLLVLLAIPLRWFYLQRLIFHVDEFISLLVIKMTMQTGSPTLPSHIFYGKGLLHSYLGAATATLFGFTEINLRALSLFLSLLIIPLAYFTSWRLFRLRWVSLIVALAVVIHPLEILWGGRVRMYSLTQLVVFSVILVLWLALHHPPRHRFAFIIPLLLLTLILSHLATIALIPPLFGSIIIIHCLIAYRERIVKVWDAPPDNQEMLTPRIKDRFYPLPQHPASWQWPLVLILLTLPAVGVGYQIGQFSLDATGYTPTTLTTTVGSSLLNLTFLNNWRHYFLDGENVLLTGFTLLGMVGVVTKLVKGRWVVDQATTAAIFIYSQLILIALELYIFIPGAVRDDRHNFMLILPFLLLGTAYGLLTLETWLQVILKARIWQKYLTVGLGGLVALLLLFTFGPPTTQLLVGEITETYPFDHAFETVAAQADPADQIMSVHPAAAWLYLGDLDYYAKQKKEFIFLDPQTGTLRDAYTGATYLNTVAQLNETMNQAGRLWFVVDEDRLKEHYEPPFSQELLHQLQLVERQANLLILIEKPDRWPLAVAPDHLYPANFDDQLQFEGYSIQRVADQLRLTLFWRTLAPHGNYKIFVQVRDNAGNTVAQADFLPYDNLVRMPQWADYWGPDLVRTGTLITLPPDVAANLVDYRLFSGVYNPYNNFERIPLRADQSGENALVLPLEGN